MSQRRPLGPLFLVLATLCGSLVLAGPGGAQESTEPEPGSLAEAEEQGAEPTDLDRAETMLQTLQTELDSLTVLQARSTKAEDEELQLLRIQAGRHLTVIDDVEPDLVDLLKKLDPQNERTGAVTAGFRGFITDKYDIYEQAIRWWMREIEQLRKQRSVADLVTTGEIETRISAARGRLDDLWDELAEVIVTAADHGIDTDSTYERFDRFLQDRAENLLGRLQVAANTRNEIRKQVRQAERARAPEDEISPLRTRLQYTEARVAGVAASLSSAADLLAKRGFETTLYRQAVIKSTGEISERVLDPKVVLALARDLLRTIGEWFSDNGPTILVKLLIIVTTVILSRMFFRLAWWLMRAVGLIRLTRLMVQLGNSLISPIATIVGLFLGLWLVGADPTTLLTGAGVAGVIIGFALQDSLANLAAGFFILATRPFDIDDVISTGGVVGTVKAMWIANTTVVTFDGRRLLIPNRKIWADVIENRSVEPNRRVDVTVRVGFEADIDGAIAILQDLVAKEERLLENPAPSIFVAEWAESWVEIALRPWARNENWWDMLTDLPRQVALRFAAEGIDIPYPRLAMATWPEPEAPASGDDA
jgi:small conductance mechanosensitive channel